MGVMKAEFTDSISAIANGSGLHCMPTTALYMIGNINAAAAVLEMNSVTTAATKQIAIITMRGFNAQLFCPHLHNAHEEHHDGIIDNERTLYGNRQRQAQENLTLSLWLSQQMSRNPLKHTSIREPGNNHAHHPNNQCRSADEAGKGFGGIQYARDEKHADGTQKHHVGPESRKQQCQHHRNQRYDGNPCIKSKS